MALVRDAAYRFDERGHNVLPLADGAIVYRHAALGLSSGRVRPLQTGDRFVGFAGRRVDSRGLAVGAPPLDVPIIASGTVDLTIAGVSATDVGASVYASDDNTFALAGSSVIGTVGAVATPGVARVAFNAMAASVAPGVGAVTAAAVQAALAADPAGARRSMGAAPVPVSQLIVGLGDSLTANGVFLTAGAPQYTVASALNWGCALLKQAVWMPVGITSGWSSGSADIVNYCLAVSGVTSAHVLNTQVPAARLLRAGWWSVQCGTNDLTILSGDSVSTICGRIRSIVEAGIDAGVRIALWTVPPRSDSQWSASSGLISAGGSTIAAQRAKHVALNNWIRRYAQETPGVVLIDPFSDLVDAASSTADWLANYAPDGTHWGTRGAFVAGRVFARAMTPFVKEVTSGSLSQLDVYDATLNPEGNLLPVATFTMQGTGGAIGGTGVSGTVPTGWTQDLETGTLTPGTAALVAQARSDALAGGREIQITFAGSAPGNFTLRFYGAAAAVPANGRFFAEVEYSANITAGGLRGVELLAFTQSGSPSVFPAAFAPDATAIPAGVSFDAVARTPIVASSGAINNLLMIRVNGAANVEGTVRIRRVNVRRVDSGSLGLLLGA